jgi:hypothetical protein
MKANLTLILTRLIGLAALALLAASPVFGQGVSYAIVDTGQTNCYNNTGQMTCPSPGQPFYGQDSQFAGNPPSYTRSADGRTIYDNVTRLTWMQSPDTDLNGTITYADKLTFSQAQALPATLNAASYGGYNDWRLPTIKELYSLINFNGTDVNPNGTTGGTPFIDTNYFGFAYGFLSNGERIIDSQWATSTRYVSTTMGGNETMFGVNFADGRIKGYPSSDAIGKKYHVLCVRGNTSYGINNFTNNGDGTVTDCATGLMWAQSDSGPMSSAADSDSGMNWSNALAWVQTRNSANYLGHNDWRLPNAKELHSILDYTRCPDASGSAAIDPLFTCTQITNEGGAADFPFYWASTTHLGRGASASEAVYIASGRALGYLNSTWLDVHGAGAQRSDPKAGAPNPYGHGPQGDVVRVFNYVRPVRTILPAEDSVGDGIPNGWRAQYFGGTGMTTNAYSCATCDPDGDGAVNYCEYVADTNSTNSASRLAIIGIGALTNHIQLTWTGGANAWQYLESTPALTSNQWTTIFTNTPPTPITNTVIHNGVLANSNRFYRIRAWR